MKLLLDEMWSDDIAHQLRLRGHDVESVVARSDLAGHQDPEILRAATIERRVIVTENIHDFRRLGREAILRGDGHSGFVFTDWRRFNRRDSRTPGRMVTALDRLLVQDPILVNLELWLG